MKKARTTQKELLARSVPFGPDVTASRESVFSERTNPEAPAQDLDHSSTLGCECNCLFTTTLRCLELSPPVSEVFLVEKLIISISVGLIVAVTLGLIGLEAHHHSKYGHFVPLGLHADVTDFKTDTGSGTAILFDAHLTNFGLYPQEIDRCEFVSDPNAHQVNVAYRVERFEDETRGWKTVFDNAQNFCRKYPLGVTQAKIVRKALWTGQTLSAGAEAMAQRAIPRNGDTMRFVIEANGQEFPTGRFAVSEVYTH